VDRPLLEVVSSPGAEPLPGRLARLTGTIVGFQRGQQGYCWVVLGGGLLVSVEWPTGYHVRFSPLELLNSVGRVVATGGHTVTIAGGWAHRLRDSRDQSGDQVFVANEISNGDSSQWSRPNL
jgi:hypothetical protein